MTFDVKTWSEGCQVINGTAYLDPENKLIDCSAFAAVNNSEIAGNPSKTRGAYNVLLDLVTALGNDIPGNSVKYTPEKTVIHISAFVEGETTHVIVSNQGPQVPQEHLEKIFDKFFRITAADRVTGTGLGLSICKGIIEAHGGKLWAENLTDGLAFHFTLPLIWDGVPPPKLPMDTETE